MVQRIYLSKSVIQLREIALNNLHNLNVIVNLKQELSFRTTKAARQLLKEIESGATISSASPPLQDRVVFEMTDVQNPVVPELVCRYEELRQTFSAKGSMLSRWGMTELMPKEFMGLIAELWFNKISTVPDQYGRTQELLIKNMRDLEIECDFVREDA
jgi:hypothetical protein